MRREEKRAKRQLDTSECFLRPAHLWLSFCVTLRGKEGEE
jgi:hypothetical protein